MKKPHLFIPLLVICITVLVSFRFKFHPVPAWYHYSGPYVLENNFSQFNKGNLYFYVDGKPSLSRTECGNSTWRDEKVDSGFIVYLVNNTDTNVQLTHQDGSLIMIQEAQDPTGKWSPVEYWIYSDCGNSYFNSPTIGPNQYIKIPVPKYKGKFQTKLRLKLKIRKGVFYSDPFNGSVSPEQFKQAEPKTEWGQSYLDEK